VGQAERGATQEAAGIAPEVVELEQIAAGDRLQGDWLELAERHENSSYFQTPDWVLSWWESLGARTHTRVAAWRTASGELDALVALSRSRERLNRRLALAVPVYSNSGSGAGDADHCAWLVAPDRRGDVAEWLGAATAGSALLVRGAAPDWPAETLPAGARTIVSTACPRVPLPIAESTGQPSDDFVRQLRRFTRRLERKGVRFDWVAPPGVDEPLLEALFELHAQGRHGGSFGKERLGLHSQLLRRAAPGRGPAAVVARREEQIVGVLYGFCWRDTFAAYQQGWDRAFARDALGNVLVLHALEFATEQGLRSFDFLRGREPYKYRFGAHDEWDRTWLVPRGVAGALLAAIPRRGRPDAEPRSPG
jgi:CelD/BcsL family acetyltransferase involved in cellulose biosynthesis